jgi:hypothetical protein
VLWNRVQLLLLLLQEEQKERLCILIWGKCLCCWCSIATFQIIHDMFELLNQSIWSVSDILITKTDRPGKLEFRVKKSFIQKRHYNCEKN